MDSVPCVSKEREALNSLRPIMKRNNTDSFAQKCEIIERIVVQTFNQSHTRIFSRSEMTILIMVHKIFMLAFIGTEQYTILSEVPDTQRQVAKIVKWILNLRKRIRSSKLPREVKLSYGAFVFAKSLQINIVHLRLMQREEILRNPNLQNNRTPTFLKDEESLDTCPGLKDKLTSSTKTLMTAAGDDLCSICLQSKISTQENFAILNNCVHLFCRSCIGEWFKTV